MEEPVEKPKRYAKIFRGVGWAAVLASLLLLGLVVICFLDGRDALAAVSVFPIWIWAIAGIAAAAITIPLLRSRFPVTVILLWALAALIGSDECRSAFRSLTGGALKEERAAAPEGKASLRIITLNCGGRSIDAVRELARFQPDIIFLQEAPGTAELAAFAKELYGESGSVAGAWHCAIVAKGKLTPRRTVLYQHGRGALLELADGTEIELLSVHLTHATTRWDLWRRSCWKQHRDVHRERRGQLKKLLDTLATDGGDVPRIFGGDFNAPPSSNLFDSIPDDYTNAFSAEGRGLGNTFINRFPVLRIDHIYTSSEFETVTARAVRTRHSDHRMVVCDVLLEKSPAIPASGG